MTINHLKALAAAVRERWESDQRAGRRGPLSVEGGRLLAAVEALPDAVLVERATLEDALRELRCYERNDLGETLHSTKDAADALAKALEER